TDTLAIGMVTTELLTGHHPFEGPNEQAMIEKFKSGQHSDLPEFVPKELKDLIIAMLSLESKRKPISKQIMQQSTIKIYHRIQEEKENPYIEINDDGECSTSLMSQIKLFVFLTGPILIDSLLIKVKAHSVVIAEIIAQAVIKVISELKQDPEEERVMINRALGFLHCNGIIHRDIKPANIFVMIDGVYIAAEVFTFRISDYSTDTLAIGMVTTELLTGHHPFEGPNEQAMIEKFKSGQHSDLPEFVPKELKDLIIAMLSLV
ncbi:MAG: hypothetical protein EZS28_042873, partial [Streblomastix strix]